MGPGVLGRRPGRVAPDGRVTRLVPQAGKWGALFESSAVDPEVVQDVEERRIVVMNPPFTANDKKGRKFTPEVVKALQRRELQIRDRLAASDAEAVGFIDANSIRTMFTPPAEKILAEDGGVLATVMPVTACTGASELRERRFLASRFRSRTGNCWVVVPTRRSRVTLVRAGLAMLVVDASRRQSVEPPCRRRQPARPILIGPGEARPLVAVIQHVPATADLSADDDIVVTVRRTKNYPAGDRADARRLVERPAAGP